MLETELPSRDVFTRDGISDLGIEKEPVGFVRGLSNNAYHHGPGLSRSDLALVRKSPWHYHALKHLELPEWVLVEDDPEKKAAQFAGTLCHCATLEPEAFDERYVVGPTLNKNSSAWKAFVEDAKPRKAITRKQRETAFAQAAAMRDLADVAEIMDGGEFEVSGYWRDPATGVLCRCRPDCMNRQFGTYAAPASVLLDVKTTSDASSLAVLQNTIARWGYHWQADFYTRGVEAITGAPVLGFIFIFVESSFPFGCRVVELDARALEVARRENDKALQLFSYCERMNAWPGYSQACEVVSLPGWARSRE
jgi:exodeoxyribonuclease VIII